MPQQYSRCKADDPLPHLLSMHTAFNNELNQSIDHEDKNIEHAGTHLHVDK